MTCCQPWDPKPWMVQGQDNQLDRGSIQVFFSFYKMIYFYFTCIGVLPTVCVKVSGVLELELQTAVG